MTKYKEVPKSLEYFTNQKSLAGIAEKKENKEVLLTPPDELFKNSEHRPPNAEEYHEIIKIKLIPPEELFGDIDENIAKELKELENVSKEDKTKEEENKSKKLEVKHKNRKLTVKKADKKPNKS